MKRFLASLIACLILTGCGPDLGDPTLRNVDWAQTLPNSVEHTRRDEGYLVLQFQSDADLNGEEINALYAKGSLCPWNEHESMPVFGPFTVSSEPRHLPLFDRGKEHHQYLVYVPVAAEVYGARKQGRLPVIDHYDLRQAGRELCLVIEHAGYPTATRSAIVRLALPDLLIGLED